MNEKLNVFTSAKICSTTRFLKQSWWDQNHDYDDDPSQNSLFIILIKHSMFCYTDV